MWCCKLSQSFLHSIFCLAFLCNWINVEGGNHNYRDALAKSILFFQGQRSGRLPPPRPQGIAWRSDSGLSDGRMDGVDLTGGYYDAGDNVKFNFPMAFTTTMLSWGAVEYGRKMGPDQLNTTREAIRWGTDYLLKCARATPGKLYVGVGDPNADHSCWERPEDMDTVRSVYSVSASNPGSDVAGETAAALAAASIVFRRADPDYGRLLLETAGNVMQFAVDHRGSYSDSLGGAVCPFYCSYSGYKDELLWGAAWLLRATKSDDYLNLIRSLGVSDETTDTFSWDNKYAGAYVLLARQNVVKNDPTFQTFTQHAENFMCKILTDPDAQYTPGGLIYKMGGSNLQYVTSITFLLTTYAKYMSASSRHTFDCGDFHTVNSAYLRVHAKKQVDYILGDNPLKMSYMVGYGEKYPLRIHHRGSSLPSLNVRDDHPVHIGCEDGMQYYFPSPNPNPNILTGAIVGGPDHNDNFADERDNYQQTEPATYINAPMVGTLAYFAGRKH